MPYSTCLLSIKSMFVITPWVRGNDKYLFCFSNYVIQYMATILLGILKHLRQFVQSDWFLPVFISHDKDMASGAPD